MAALPKYRLHLETLDFISAVDTPAQETASVVLMKRDGGGELTAKRLNVQAHKVNDEIGLVFGWAFTSKIDGADYFDLQGDHISEDEIIKVAAEFMRSSGAMDEMHDGVAKGTTVFAMPWTAEVAKAFLGIDTDTAGLMVAIAPPPDVLAKFKTGEYTGWSIGGTGERVPLDKTAQQLEYSKRGQLTTATDGHTHLVDDEGTSGHTSWEGEPNAHSHPYVIDDAGLITIGEAYGHKHKVVLGKRAPSTPAPQETDMNALEKLQKALAHATAYGALTDAEKAHCATLDDAGQEAFVAMPGSGRAEVLAKAVEANSVVYKALDGAEFRKSDDERVWKAIKRADEATTAAIAREAVAKRAEFAKRADVELSHMAGDEAVKVAFLTALESVPEEQREGVTALVKAANDTLGKMFETVGVVGGIDTAIVPGDDGSPLAKIKKMAAEMATAQGISEAVAFTKVLETDEGKRLHGEHRASSN